VSRPSEAEVDEALETLQALADGDRVLDVSVIRRANRVLREAVAPRPVWPVKEAAECLGIHPANVRPESTKGLPKPAQAFARPTVNNPNRTWRLFYVDEIEEHPLAVKRREELAARRRAERTER
jgi:hypothetical protein